MTENRIGTPKPENPSLSVVIPAYNSEKIIEKCITAIMAASPTNKEIIVVDDASTDNTFDIISRFPVKLVRLTNNCGPATARNYGAAHSTGDIIVFVDSDVIVLKNSLDELVHVLEKKRAGATGGLARSLGNTLISDSYSVRFLGESSIADKNVREVQSIGGGLVAYPRKVLQEVGGYNEKLRIGEDLDLNIRIGDAGYKQFLVPTAVAYHDVPSSLSKLARKWFHYGIGFWNVCKKHHLIMEPIKILGWVLTCFLLLIAMIWSRELLLLPILVIAFWLPWAFYYGKLTLIYWVRMKNIKHIALPIIHQIMIISRTLGFIYAMCCLG